MNNISGVIQKISEVESFKIPGDNSSWPMVYTGYRVETDQGDLLVLVSDQPNCCESWGYMSSEDDLDSFVGAVITGVSVVETSRQKMEITSSWSASDDAVYLDCGDVMFVDVETTMGVVQFAVYNSHNGYYGHSAVLHFAGKEIESATL